MPAVKRALITFCAVLAGLTLLAWAFFPWKWPLFDPQLRFSDLTENYERLRLLAQGTWGGPVMFVYPAPALAVFAFFIRLFSQPVLVFLIFSAAVYLAGAALLRRAIGPVRDLSTIVSVTIAITLLCAYPALFQMDRGNIEIVSFLFLVGGVTCFAKRQYWAAAVLFGLAGSIKPFPLLFVYLLLTKRLYKQVFLAGAVFLAANLLSLAWIGPTVLSAYQSLAADKQIFFQKFLLKYHPNAIHFDHSLFSCIKQAIRLLLGWTSEEAMAARLQLAYFLYVPLAGILAALCLWAFRSKPALNQLFAVTVIILIVPPLSYDYTLLALYIAWGAFLIHLLHDSPMARPLLFLIPFAILMTPHPLLRFGMVGCGGQVNALLLLFLLGAAYKIDLPSSLFGELKSMAASRLDATRPSGVSPLRASPSHASPKSQQRD